MRFEHSVVFLDSPILWPLSLCISLPPFLFTHIFPSGLSKTSPPLQVHCLWSPFLVSSHIMCFFLGTLNNLLLDDQCVSPSCNISSLLADASNSLLSVVCSPMGTHMSSYTITAWKDHRVWVYNLGLCSKLCWAGLVWDVLLGVQEPECWDYRQLRYHESLSLWPTCLMEQFGVGNPWWWVVWWPLWAKHQIQPALEGPIKMSTSKGKIVRRIIMRTRNARTWEDVVREHNVRTSQVKMWWRNPM